MDQSVRVKSNFTFIWNKIVEGQFKLVENHWDTSLNPPNHPNVGEVVLYFPQKYSKNPGASKLYFIALVTELNYGRSIPDYRQRNDYKPRRVPNDFPTSLTLQYVHKNTVKSTKKPLRFCQALDLINYGKENPEKTNKKTLNQPNKVKQGLLGTPANPVKHILDIVGLEDEIA